MDVSVVVTCFNEENNIIPCLESLTGQEEVRGQYEIIVTDGDSQDGTQEKVRDFTGRHNNVRLVIEPKKGTAAGRNAGIKAAMYDYIAFIDADCVAPPRWLATLAAGYRKAKDADEKIVAVGGKNLVPGTISEDFVKAIGIALDSYLGSFGSTQGRQFSEQVYVNSLATLNVLYEKANLLKVKGFDETLFNEGEDADLNYRLSSEGFKFLYLPDSFVWHKMRPSLSGWFKNMFRYGKARARLLKRYPEMWSPAYLLPLLFVLALTLTLFSKRSKVFLLPLLYFPALFLYSVYLAGKKNSSKLFWDVMMVYLIQHFGYAAGELYGLIHPGVR